MDFNMDQFGSDPDEIFGGRPPQATNVVAFHLSNNGSVVYSGRVEAPQCVSVETGFVRTQPNNAEGDCLFVALSQQLGYRHTPIQLRNIAVDYMAAHLEVFGVQLMALGWEMEGRGELPPQACGGSQPLHEAVMALLRLPWTWGGAECISAISLHFNVPVRVFQERGPTIVFAPPSGSNSAQLRVIHRFGGSSRGARTHYESVTSWSFNPPQVNAQVDLPILSQSVAGNESVLEVSVAGNESFLAVPVDRVNETSGAVASSRPASRHAEGESSDRILRSRPAGWGATTFKREDFSEGEDVRPSEHPNKFRQCRICRRRVGKYCILCCGAYPLCGTCVKEWFLEVRASCGFCGAVVPGWTKVFNQNK